MFELFVALIVGVSGLIFGVFSYLHSRKVNKSIEIHQKETSQRVYELSILKELGERIGYSLNVQQIIDVITGSLHQFIDYTAVSYMLIEPEKIIFKVNLEKSINREFVDEIRNRMAGSLSALLDKDFNKDQIEEIISGAILTEDIKEPVKSFFNIPIVIAGKVEGVLTISDSREGMYKEEEMTILYRIMQQASNAVSKLQEVVKTEQGKLNAMVQSMTEGVVMTDNDYRILVANPAARSAVGINENKEDITIFDFIDKLGGKFDIRGKLEESVKLDKLLQEPEILMGDRFFQIFVSPVKSKSQVSDQKAIGSVVIFHDITHDKEVEKLKEDFTSMMVHELRSPLDGIKKRIEVLREMGNKDQKMEEELTKTIYQNASSMLELVNDLLDAAKLESGKFQLIKQPYNIRKVIEERASFFDILARDSDLIISYKVTDDVPDNLEMDPMRIEQVLNNLISNSIKFTDPGGQIKIQTLLHKSEQDILKEASDAGIDWMITKESDKISDKPDSVVVSITDTGSGIADENMPHLFNKFKQFRATAVDKGKSGTGLGLFIAKGIVEGHDGIIGLASKEGAGSTFYFTIPLTKQ